uniref:Uncharacterized protein n=1 Tax=Glossina pallidipes TaxID=7398 RepID=A0A1A9ZDE2_GLOPL
MTIYVYVMFMLLIARRLLLHLYLAQQSQIAEEFYYLDARHLNQVCVLSNFPFAVSLLLFKIEKLCTTSHNMTNFHLNYPFRFVVVAAAAGAILYAHHDDILLLRDE